MKFGKTIRAAVDCSYPEWQPKFMSYKELKKRIHPRDSSTPDNESRDDDTLSKENLNKHSTTKQSSSSELLPGTTPEHAQFLTQLKHEVEKVNDFFLEKEEDYIIEHGQLSARVKELMEPGSATRAEVNRLRKRLIDFHAQLVILEHYSTVNYTGFRKILKKHDKKTGTKLRETYLRNVTITPFFLSDTVRNMLLDTERQLQELDHIRKFRHTDPQLDLPALPALQPISDATVLANPLRPTQTSPNVQDKVFREPIVTEFATLPASSTAQRPPLPFLSSRSPLCRLYRHTVAFALAAATSSGTLQPPQSLIDVVDAITTKELGLTDSFVSSITQPCNYCIAADNTFSIGFFMLTPGATLQLFNFDSPWSVISRLMHGRARLRMFCNRSASSSDTVVSDKDSCESSHATVEECGSGRATGPWPAVTSRAVSSHHEWVPETVCAVFYAFCPPVQSNELARYALVPLAPPAFRVEREDNDTMPSPQAWC